jgi:hypothetical protein
MVTDALRQHFCDNDVQNKELSMPKRQPTVDKAKPPLHLSRRSILGAGTIAVVGGALALGSPAFAMPSRSGMRSTLTPAPEGKAWATVWQDRFLEGALDETVWTRYDGPGQTDLRDQQYNDPTMVEVSDGRLILTAQAKGKNGFAYTAGTVSTAGKRTIGPFGRLTTRQ